MYISESFYSIQAEGASVGIPAYFIRLKGCNLMCGGTNGSLMKEGKATWWCDSERLWRQGSDITNEELEERIINEGILDGVLNGSIHIVWTGGEPTLKQHQSDIMNFIDYLRAKHFSCFAYCEIETNGTILTDSDLYGFYIDQINCSPKLANSGIDKNIRIKPDVINDIVESNGYFKFVISSEDDIKEIQKDFIIPFNIPACQVIIMPGVDNRNDLPERTRFLFDMSKKYGYRGVTRQQILAWDKQTGV